MIDGWIIERAAKIYRRLLREPQPQLVYENHGLVKTCDLCVSPKHKIGPHRWIGVYDNRVAAGMIEDDISEWFDKEKP